MMLGSGVEECLDGDNRKSLLKTEKSSGLYFWKLAHNTDMLSRNMAKLSNDVRADSDDVLFTNTTLNGDALKTTKRKKNRNLNLLLKIVF